MSALVVKISSEKYILHGNPCFFATLQCIGTWIIADHTDDLRICDRLRLPTGINDCLQIRSAAGYQHAILLA